LNEAFEKVKAIAKDCNEEELNKKYEELVIKVGSCVLTCNSFVEAIKCEDCLCISFDINRPEIAIVDATRIGIKKIFPTIICATAFIDSAKYAIRLDAEASGGFGEQTKGSIVKGISAENITAVLPIYICPEHWEVAKLLMKPILGWDVTLDPVGYNYFQKKVVPFLLLTKSMEMTFENSKSQFNANIYEWLMDTCVAIIRDDMEPSFGGTMKQDVTEIYDGYMVDGSKRTADVVQSNAVILSHFYVFTKMGLITKPTKETLAQMLRFMTEEELRRRQTDITADKIKDVVIGLLDFDCKKHVETLIELQKKAETKEEVKEEVIPQAALTEREVLFEKTFLDELERHGKLNKEDIARRKILSGSADSQIVEIKAPIKSSSAGTSSSKVVEKTEEKKEKEAINTVSLTIEDVVKAKTTADFTNKQSAAITEYQKIYKEFAGELWAWMKFFYPEEELDMNKVEKLEFLGLKTPAQYLALYIQNQFQGKNADRKSAHTSKKYRNPFSEAEAEEYLLTVANNLIMDGVTKYMHTQGKKGPAKSTEYKGDSTIFVETTDLNVAAGYLMVVGCDVGQFQSLQNMWRSEVNTGVPQLTKEKLEMIRDKSYRGIHMPFVTVIPRKRFMRKLYKQQMVSYNYNDWKELWFK
jgi:hypothetical protein